MENADRRRRLAVIPGVTVIALGPELDPGDVFQPHHRAALSADNNILKLFRRGEACIGEHGKFASVAFQPPTRNFDILGADRILVVGVRDETADKAPAPDKHRRHPSFAQIAGYMLDTLFRDGLYSDLERMTRINQMIDAVEPEHRSGALADMRAIDTMLIVPSEDLRVIAHEHRRKLPLAIRALLRGISGRSPSENRLLSFLLFEQAYTRDLIDLGYQDAMKVQDELLAFVSGAEVPRLFAPNWIRKDLSSLHGEE